MRIAIYCHDGMGIGHLFRSMNIARAIIRVDPKVSVLILTGSPHAPMFCSVEGVDWLKLPALQKRTDGGYQARELTVRLRKLINWRAKLLTTSIVSFEPDLLLVDKSPLGVCNELAPALRWLVRHRRQTRLVFGMRDIEDDAERTMKQWSRLGVAHVFAQVYHRIWIYGCQDVFDVGAQYQLTPSVQEKLEYLGYVASDRCIGSHEPITPSDIVVTVGGGTDGQQMLATYLEAAPRIAAAGLTTTMIGGPDLPRDVSATLRSRAASLPAVQWVEVEPCMNCRYRASRLVVCMGGYNTLTTLALLGTRTIIVPRCGPRMEQTLRARLWQQAGLADVIELSELTPQRLATGVLDALRQPERESSCSFELNALQCLPEALHRVMNTSPRDAPAVCL